MKNDTHYLLTPELNACGKGLGETTVLKVGRTIQPVVVVIEDPAGDLRRVTLQGDGEQVFDIPVEASIMARCSGEAGQTALIVGEPED